MSAAFSLLFRALLLRFDIASHRRMLHDHRQLAALVWSVGVDGEDDGGPQPLDAGHDTGNDDIGLRMTVGAPATP